MKVRRSAAGCAPLITVVFLLGACHSSSVPHASATCADGATDPGQVTDGGHGPEAGKGRPILPLVLVADVDLPGKPVRFDYQDLDPAKGHLVIAHMNDASVVVVNTSDGSLVKSIPNIPMARGVAVADDVGRIFVTSSPNELVILDDASLRVIARVDTGSSPDGVGWDPIHDVVGVSDQGDGAVSLLSESGQGARVDVPLGAETGNIVFDASRSLFWVTVVSASPPNRLVAVDPVTKKATTSIALPGCAGAHGLRMHPDGRSALVACEDDAKVLRVDLQGSHAIDVATCGASPDVLAIDPGLGLLYVAAESGELTVFDVARPGLVRVDTEHPGDGSHSIAVDPVSHHVFLPLAVGPHGTPVLRIMKPGGA